MKLTPRKKDKLLIFAITLPAERRRGRGLKLSYPETVAFISAAIIEGACDGKTVTNLIHYDTTPLTCNNVMDGTTEVIPDIQVEATFPDGIKLVTVRHPIVWIPRFEARTPLTTMSPAMTPTLSRFVRSITVIALTFGASIVFARPGHPGHTTEGSLFAGLLHLLTGTDHLLAMVAAGVWSALVSRSVRGALRTPVAFVTLMILGALLGADGVATPMAGPIITASLLVFDLLIAARAQLPTWGGALLCGAFALFHDYTHDMEFPTGTQAMFPYFVSGFAAATALLHATGIGAGFALKPRLA